MIAVELTDYELSTIGRALTFHDRALARSKSRHRAALAMERADIHAVYEKLVQLIASGAS